MPDADIHVFQVDGGQPLVSDSTSVNSIGVLYPAERVDFVIAWQDGDSKTDTEIVVKLDKEYVLLDVTSDSTFDMLTWIDISCDRTLHSHQPSPSYLPQAM